MFANMHFAVSKSLISVVGAGVILLLVSGCKQAGQNKLRIATAANVQYAMADLVSAFSEQSSIDAELVISSSGKLSTQIAQGAPYDVFVSADMQYPQYLFDSGHATDEPRLYAYGEIVIWSSGDVEPVFDAMLLEDVEHVAIANPKTAPYGVLAITALGNAGILEDIRDKLVFGENVGQVNQFAFSGAAEIAITAKSMVLSDHMSGKGSWTPVSEELYAPIPQGLIIIERDAGFRDEAIKFYDFLISDTARRILSENGYKLPAL